MSTSMYVPFTGQAVEIEDEVLDEAFECCICGEFRPAEEGADGDSETPATICLDCLDLLAEREERDRQMSRFSVV